MSDPTVDFGAPDSSLAHRFRVVIPAARHMAVSLIEDYGVEGGTHGRPEEELRAEVPRPAWAVLGDVARRDFNERLKTQKQSTGRWKPGATFVDRLLGRELCVLAWAAEGARPDQLPVIGARWGALRPTERWWLFAMTVAEAGQAGDGQRGWRRALQFALSDGEQGNGTPRRPRIAPPITEQLALFPRS